MLRGPTAELDAGCSPEWHPKEAGREAFDMALVALSAALILAYHALYYRWHFTSIIEGRGFHRVDLAGQRGRQIFVRAVCSLDGGRSAADCNADTNLAIQAARNPITAGSLLATGATLGATTLVNILLDGEKLEAIRRLGQHDPLAGASSVWSPSVKISCAVCALFLSFFSMAQSLRLFVHFSFFVRAASFCRQHPEHYGETTAHEMFDNACRTCLRAQTFFSLGLRWLYCFLPLVFWLAGSTYLLAGTTALVLALYNLDNI